ncbi:hypothetical protein CUMW_012010 [Citrus unshiu]|nr:hypothetical protein CUMW_012010 [Citrus unshiu]
MSSNSHLPLIYKKGKPNLLVEVANTDKQLVTLIHSKGLLCPEVQELYHRVCSSYEKILLNDYDQAELQDVEYSLWKLQYRHIDEFRKRIKKSSVSDNTMTQSGANVQRSSDNHIEGFKSFLSEAMAFYRNLVVKIKRYYGLPEESSFAKEGYMSTTLEPNKKQKYQFLCHRFLVCLGDLARYKEQYENFGAQEHNCLEDFPYTFASTMRELDAAMELDDAKLKALLESYQLMDSARTGPFRALQVVSIFIFTIENLINAPEIKGLKDKNDMQQLEFIRWALSATFIFMGRLVERCLKSNSLDSSPLLSSVLVFVEWLVGILEQAESYASDGKSRSAMSYFFGAFVGLLKQLNARSEVSSPKKTALWEDYELRGFAPVLCSHQSLDFSVHFGHIKSFEAGIECRADRVINAAMKIANRSNGSQKWIIYDKIGMRFSVAVSNVNADTSNSEFELTNDLKVKEAHQSISKSTEEYEKQILEENETSPSVLGESAVMEEEEVIVFKPLTRYNSAPLYASVHTKDSESPNDTEEQTVPPDECLRRATSLLIAQNQSQDDPLGFHSDITNFRPSKPFKQQEPPVKETGASSFSPTAISAGPPSLSSWVFNRGSGNNDREKGRSDTSMPGLSPIEEIASASLSGLTIGQTKDSVISSGQTYASSNYSSPYSAPVPSAPLLPENASWFNDVQPSSYEFKNLEGINRTNNLSDASALSSYPNLNSTHDHYNYDYAVPGFMNGYPPFRGMTSSEWLRQYRENHNLDWTNSYSWPLHHYAPRNSGNFHNQDASMLNLRDHWQVPLASNQMIYPESQLLHPGFPQVHAADEHRRDKLFPDYQRPTAYGCGVATDFRDEPQPLLQYLKEKEWLLQRDPTGRGPYMGN